jgi:uncharacterized delta-60 repeat protein
VTGDKILAGGWVQVARGDLHFALARFNANGSLDTTFGGRRAGKVVTDFNNTGLGRDRGMAMAVQADGKIVLAGITHPANAPTSYSIAFGVARYNPDGSPDTTFGSSRNLQCHQQLPHWSGSNCLWGFWLR